MDELRYRFIKYCFFSLLISLVIACDKISNNVVDSAADNYTVVAVNVPEKLFLNSVGDKVFLNYNIQIENFSAIQKVYSNIYLKNNQLQILDDVVLKDDGDKNISGDAKSNDGIFSVKLPFDTTFISGDYYIDFFVQSLKGITKKVSVASFNYDNGENNLPPVLSQLNIPDSIERNISFVFSVKASDPNGLSQIKKVYFQLYRPDGSQVLGANNDPYIPMVDDGNNEVYGDLFANDGIFSFKNSFASTAQTGTWTFRFRSQDFSNALSNEIVHQMVVK